MKKLIAIVGFLFLMLYGCCDSHSYNIADLVVFYPDSTTTYTVVDLSNRHQGIFVCDDSGYLHKADKVYAKGIDGNLIIFSSETQYRVQNIRRLK